MGLPGAVIAVATAAALISGFGGDASATRDPRTAALATVAYDVAAILGEPNPTRLEAVRTTRADALRLAYSPSSTETSTEQIVLVVGDGVFVPPKAPPLFVVEPHRGTFYAIVDPVTLAADVMGFRPTRPDLSAIGEPFRLPPR